MSEQGAPSAVRMAEGVVAGERSAAALVDASLEGIAAWQDSTNAFSRTFADDARAAASQIHDSAQRGGRLAGVPVAVKELFDVRGHPTTGCCAAIPVRPADRDAALVGRLRAEGAIVIGKTNMHELAAGVTNLESSCGPTRNPWDPTRISGGSSGGSAIAVAVGIVPLSLVSDTGGSARIPAAFCGTWGLKPGHGLLPGGGMMALAPSMDCPGLLTSSLEDLRLGWRTLLARPGRKDAATRPRVVGVLRGGRWERCHVEIRRATEGAADRFRDAGIEVRDVNGSALEDVHHVWNRVAWPEFAERYAELIGDPALGDQTASLLEWGRRHVGDLAAARARAGEIGAWFARVFAGVGLLLTPTTPYVAPEAGASEVDLGDGSTMGVDRGEPSWFTAPVNVAGLPALSVPFTTSTEGLPIGVQLIGPAGGEDALLAGAELLQPDPIEPPPPITARRRWPIIRPYRRRPPGGES